MNRIEEIIATRSSAPKAFRAVTTYDNGTERMHETETESQAQNWAIGERQKIGIPFVDRDSGEPVMRVSVTVEAIPRWSGYAAVFEPQDSE